ncbi:MAG: outer membrane beta-barrel protein [Proteobacteria bacterium]|nr:outer membrane beta-barrel protein [Pseudomonadota bacterium]
MFLSDYPTLKKVSLLTIGIFAPTFANAGDDNRSNGFYAGISGGIIQTNTKFNIAASSVFVSNATNGSISLVQQSVPVYHYKAIGALYIGYGQFFQDSNFYWAAEIFGNIKDSENTLNDAEAEQLTVGIGVSTSIADSTTVKLRDWEFGADFRPGYLFDLNTMLYGRIGVAFNELTIDNSTTFTYLSQGPLLSSIDSSSNSRNSAFLRLGVGVEHKVNDSAAITADYIYTHYGKVRTSNVANVLSGEDGAIVVNNNGLSAETSANIHSNVVMLGIRYFI